MAAPAFQRGILLKATTAPGTPPTDHIALYSTDGLALLTKDEAGVVSTVGGGQKISAMSAASALAGADQFVINQGGTSKSITASLVNAFVDPSSNSSAAAQTLGTSDTYLTDSDVTFAAGRLKAKSFYRCVIDMTKTAAGVATATMTLRMGILGTTGDAAICVFTFPTIQTAAVDNGRFTVCANLRSVGAGTSAVVEGVLFIERTNTTTGFLSTAGLQFMAPIRVTSAGFNSTTVTKMGLSVNAGAASAWTSQLVQSDVKNLV